MRRSLPSDVASLCDAVRAGEATATSALSLRHHWTGELNVYDGAGNVVHVTLTALQALFAEGEASLWQLAAAILRGDRAGALAAAERLSSVTAARAKLEAARDPAEELRRADEALAAARMGARRAELQPPVPPWVATAPVTRGYRIVRQGGEAVESQRCPFPAHVVASTSTGRVVE